MNTIRVTTVLVVTCGLALCGCSGQQYEKHQYVLGTRRPETAKAKDTMTLGVRRFHMDPAFSKRGIVSRISEHEYREDYYSQFITSPADQITEIVRNWFSDSGHFHRVSRAESADRDSLVLEGDILAFYGDARDAGSPKARAEIRITLLKGQTRDKLVVLSKKYVSESAWKPVTAEGLVAGLDSCLSTMLTELESDLGQVPVATPLKSR
jgi:ABC-type uncharacterized transport system auxiliary subunit